MIPQVGEWVGKFDPVIPSQIRIIATPTCLAGHTPPHLPHPLFGPGSPPPHTPHGQDPIPPPHHLPQPVPHTPTVPLPPPPPAPTPFTLAFGSPGHTHTMICRFGSHTHTPHLPLHTQLGPVLYYTQFPPHPLPLPTPHSSQTGHWDSLNNWFGLTQFAHYPQITPPIQLDSPTPTFLPPPPPPPLPTVRFPTCSSIPLVMTEQCDSVFGR